MIKKKKYHNKRIPCLTFAIILISIIYAVSAMII